MHEIMLDRSATTNTEFRAILEEKLKTAKWAEIHIAQDDRYLIDFTGQFAPLGKKRIRGRKVIHRKLTEDVTFFLLEQEKPLDGTCKMTPFVAIYLDNGFCSEDYGTKLYEVDKRCRRLHHIFARLWMLYTLLTLPLLPIFLLSEVIGEVKTDAFLETLSFPLRMNEIIWFALPSVVFIVILLILERKLNKKE